MFPHTINTHQGNTAPRVTGSDVLEYENTLLTSSIIYPNFCLENSAEKQELSALEHCFSRNKLPPPRPFHFKAESTEPHHNHL